MRRVLALLLVVALAACRGSGRAPDPYRPPPRGNVNAAVGTLIALVVWAAGADERVGIETFVDHEFP